MPNLSSLKSGVFKNCVKCFNNRFIYTTQKLLKKNVSGLEPKNPIQRTVDTLGKDFKYFKDYNKQKLEKPTEEFQTHCDVLIIGGGAEGSSIAYWLKEKAKNGLNVVVVDQDPTVNNRMKSFAMPSFYGLQNLSVPENIQMSLYGLEFLRNVKSHLGNDVNLNITPYGSLRLACKNSAEKLTKVSKMQNELGIRNELLSAEKIKAKFPWMNTQGISLGCHALEREGWFDPSAFLYGLKKKAFELGAHFVDGEIVDFEFQSHSNILGDGEEDRSYKGLDKAVVLMPNGEKRLIKFALCVIASDSSSGQIARLARIGKAGGILSIPLPVEERNRINYLFSSTNQKVPTFTIPLTVDTSECTFAREGLGGNYLCAQKMSSSLGQTVNTSKPVEDVFSTEIRPILSKFVDAFKDSELKSSWIETFAYNSFDENGIIGTHPYYNNLYIAAGFAKCGIQEAPAVGRALSELIIDGRYRTICLERLGFDRIIVDQPLYDDCTI